MQSYIKNSLIAVSVLCASWFGVVLTWKIIKPIRWAIKAFLFIILCSVALNIVGCGASFAINNVKKNKIYKVYQADQDKKNNLMELDKYAENLNEKTKSLKDSMELIDKEKAILDKEKAILDKEKLQNDIIRANLKKNKAEIEDEKKQIEVDKSEVEIKLAKNKKIVDEMLAKNKKIVDEMNDLKIKFVQKAMNKFTKLYRPTVSECDDLIHMSEKIEGDKKETAKKMIASLNKHRDVALSLTSHISKTTYLPPPRSYVKPESIYYVASTSTLNSSKSRIMLAKNNHKSVSSFRRGM